MSLYVDYTRKMGEAVIEDSRSKDGVRCPIYWCNGLYTICFEFKEVDTGKDMVQLVSFAVDENHLKRMLGISKGSEDNDMDFVKGFYLDFSYKECGKIAKNLATAMSKGKWHGTLSVL